MNKMMSIILISCKKATELIEKQSIEKLSSREKLKLNLHKKMCKSCLNYSKESKSLDDSFKVLFDLSKRVKEVKNDDLKTKILSILKSN
jgi:hypothetical protein